MSPIPLSPKQCDLFSKFFSTLQDFLTHKARNHASFSFVCPIQSCRFSLASESVLIAHILSCHQQPSQHQPDSQVLVSQTGLTSAMSNLSIDNGSFLVSLAAPTLILQQFGQTPFMQNFNSWSHLTKSGQDCSSNQKLKVYVN